MLSFAQMRVRTRLVVSGLIVLLGLVLSAGYTLWQIRTDALAAHDVRIRNIVEVSRGIVAHYQKLEAGQKLSREEAQLQAREALRSPRFGADDYFFIYDYEGRALMVAGAPKIEGQVMLGNTDKKGFKLWDRFVEIGKGPGQGYTDYWFPRAGQTEPKPKRAYLLNIPEWQWIIGTGVYVDDVDEMVKQAALRYGLLSFLILAVVAAVLVMVSRSIVMQLGGEPATAIALMSRAAAGDLTVDVQSTAKGSIMDSAAAMLGSIRQMVGEIGQGSLRLASGAEQIGNASREVAIASQRQSEATSSMAAAIEEMTVSINHISDRARDTQASSSSSVALSEEGFARIQAASQGINAIARTVSDASDRIGKLEDGANRISSIASVIKDIAGQTNLLALNAAIEAARAGEQGRGFAVVADEVRKLAERTSAATIEIEQMITGIQNDTVEVVGVLGAVLPQIVAGVRAAGEAAESLQQIKDGAQSTLLSVREVAEATTEQSQSSNAIAQEVEAIATMVDETTAAMQSTADTATELEKISSELSAMVRRFRC